MTIHGKMLVHLMILFSVVGCSKKKASDNKEKPNIVLIMADDMGYSDIGCYGGEIATPNIDALAEDGIRFTQFYNTARCCPTRASLMTGLYQHNTGMGWMTASNLGHPGYTGDLNNQCVTIAEALDGTDYARYMTGKWHLTHSDYQKPDASNHNWPLQRGFDRFFGHLTGGGGYYHTRTLLSNNRMIEPWEDFYLTRAVSDSTVGMIREHFKKDRDQPFFFYVAYYAPHRPLHALDEDIEKFRGDYMKGWDRLREERFKRMQKMGIADSSWKLSERHPRVPAWDDIPEEQKKIWDARMAVYAAQVHRMDIGIGRIVSVLKEHDELENTLLVFLSDNGACAERGGGPELSLEDLDRLGEANPKQSYRINWANASNTPFRWFKKNEYEGGNATPLVVHWPDKLGKQTRINKDQVGHVIDMMPTLLDVAGADYPVSYQGHAIHPVQGKSLLPALEGRSFERGPLFFEHEANRAVRSGNWKLVANAANNPPYKGEWELYNLEWDRSETYDLSEKYPEKAEELSAMWDKWAKENNVYPLDGRGWNPRIRDDHNEPEKDR